MYTEEYKDFKKIPYDIECPSVKTDIKKRICSKCSLYHASLTYLKEHQKSCGAISVIQRVRPIRIAAQRQRELMVIIRNIENQDDAEWIDDEFLDEEIEIPKFENKESPTIVSVEDHLKVNFI